MTTEERAAAADEALKPHCPDLTDAQSAQMAKLIRKIEDMEFSMMRAVNYIEHGYRGEAKAELMKWIRGQG